MHEGGILRFRCRTGHAYTVQSLLADLSESIEVMLWNAVRGIEESVALIHHIADHLQEHGQGPVSEKFLTQAQEAERRADLVRQALLGEENPKVEIAVET